MSTVQSTPIWHKYALSVPEAADYFHISEKKLRRIVEDNEDSDCFLWSGGRVLIKREKFSNFLNGVKLI